MKSSLLDATCRVAFAGLIHDLGKFAQRARIDASEASIKLHQQMYCPRRQAGDRIWWTHQHAAYTALAFPVIEKVAPALIGEKAFPFSEGDATDSLINIMRLKHSFSGLSRPPTVLPRALSERSMTVRRPEWNQRITFRRVSVRCLKKSRCKAAVQFGQTR